MYARLKKEKEYKLLKNKALKSRYFVGNGSYFEGKDNKKTLKKKISSYFAIRS